MVKESGSILMEQKWQVTQPRLENENGLMVRNHADR